MTMANGAEPTCLGRQLTVTLDVPLKIGALSWIVVAGFLCRLPVSMCPCRAPSKSVTS